jgi:hypothetical protein
MRSPAFATGISKSFAMSIRRPIGISSEELKANTAHASDRSGSQGRMPPEFLFSVSII